MTKTYHAYDGMGRLTDLDHKQSTTVLAGYDYIYDAASRVTSINSTVEGLSTFTYDVTNQLTSADHASPRADESYSYDSNGNRTMAGYVVGSNNLTTSDGTYSYLYDNEGNMVKKTTIADGAYEEYTWDYRNRLTNITFKNSSHAILKTVDHTYDAFNRWLRRTYDPDGPGAAAATDQFFAYDGYNPVLEFSGPSDTNLTHRYLWGPAVDQILADEQVTSLSSAGNILWGLSDHLGTPRDLADLNESTGITSVTNHRTYNSFGLRTAETNAAVDLLFGFTGKAFDEVTGLQNNINRLYDARLGQFPSEDRSVFNGTDTNLRRYGYNNPASYVDPDGNTSIYFDDAKEMSDFFNALAKSGVSKIYVIYASDKKGAYLVFGTQDINGMFAYIDKQYPTVFCKEPTNADQLKVWKATVEKRNQAIWALVQLDENFWPQDLAGRAVPVVNYDDLQSIGKREQELNVPVVIDIGGVGKVAGAINVSDTATNNGKPIPNLILTDGVIPLPRNSVAKIVGRAPTRIVTMFDLMRVLAPKGNYALEDLNNKANRDKHEKWTKVARECGVIDSNTSSSPDGSFIISVGAKK